MESILSDSMGQGGRRVTVVIITIFTNITEYQHNHCFPYNGIEYLGQISLNLLFNGIEYLGQISVNLLKYFGRSG